MKKTRGCRLPISALAILSMMFLFSYCGRSGDSGASTDGEWHYGEETDSLSAVAAPPPEPDYIRLPDTDSALRYMRTSGHWDDYSTGILPDMAGTALKYVEKLINSEHRGFIVVDKERMRLLYFDPYGNERFCWPMACSRRYGTKHKRRDNRTPEGFFTVYKVYDSTDWLYTDDDGNESKVKGQFGPRFIRLSIPGTSQIGIHGTCAPWSLGGRRSHGCIRISNENILTLVEMVDSGMPVIVSPGRRDLEVNASEGVWIPAISTRPGHAPARIVPSRSENIVSDTTEVVPAPEDEEILPEIPDSTGMECVESRVE